MRRLPISQASDDELRVFARDVLQIESEELGKADTRAKLLAVVGKVHSDEYIIAEDAAPVVEGQEGYLDPDIPTIPRELGGFDFGPLVVLKLMQTDSVGGKHPANPNVNGRQVIIQRNMKVAVPYAYYEALAHAVTGSITQEDSDTATPGKMIHTDVTNYPLAEVVLPPRAEVDAWRRKMEGVELGTRAAVALAA